MKSLDEAIEKAKYLQNSEKGREIYKLLLSAQRKTNRIEISFNEMLDYIETKIRYKIWNQEWLDGLRSYEIDEIVIEADQAINACKRR